MQGLYRYFATNVRGKKGQRGFTLIELLVVVTILGVLAAIVTLSLVGLTSNAEAKACQQEYRTIQSGLDAYMAYFNVSTVTGNEPTGTNDMSVDLGKGPLFNAGGSPTFVRNSPTVYTYVWDVNGRIKNILPSAGGPAVPNGCKASGT